MSWEDLGQVVPNIEYIDIQASDYNPTIDDNITITVTVTDQNGDPIGNQGYTLKCNGTTLTTLTTNSNGVATYTYTCNTWGVCRFSVKSFTTHINVGGWKQVYSNGGLVIYKNNTLTKMVCNVQNFTCPSGGWTTVRTYDSTYNPPAPLFFTTNNSNVALRVYANGSKVECYNTGSSSTTMNIQFTVIY